MTRAPLFGCIEAGGTKFMLGVARDCDTILDTVRIPTSTPDVTLRDALAFFVNASNQWGSFDAFGIASFGPVDLDRLSSSWGRITDTPKAGWTGVDLVGPVGNAFDCPVGFDTDVNGAILAESLWGAAVGADIAVYVTVGTGIGGGALVEERLVHGARHPEMGHMLPRRHALDLEFPGICPYHGCCLEGLSSGPAIMARWRHSLSELPQDHPAHEIIAYYLAQMIVAQQAFLSPRRVVLGGGVMATPGLIERVRTQTSILGGGYFGSVDFDGLIVEPALGDRAGLLGALALAQRARR
ncbi:fructokinase [Sphingobium lactosutens]|uniref:ROK family protein n=1 Tax=Sphingobium lactosutens TaxID=522773 RepID=UPI0015BE6FE9|nr:ROK family protein [Sphingobium lactosutens]NWK98404.1 fructokinase [Sphingobium lactosutens]